MKTLSLIVGLTIVLWCSPLWAATYYIDPSCSSNGDGTTTSCGTNGPFKGWSEVTWAPGNTYAQKGGTTWYGTITVGASGTAAAPITITSYGTGMANLSGLITVSAWTANDPVSGTYSTPSVSGYAWYEDGVPLLYGSRASSLTPGQVYWNSGAKNYYVPTTATPSSHTIQATLCDGIYIGSNNYITINNLSFLKYAEAIGNLVGGPHPSGLCNTGITVTNCTFDDVGWAVNIINNNAMSSAINISNNNISYAGNSIELGAMGTGYYSNCTIANNQILYCSEKEGSNNLWRIQNGGYHYTFWYYDSEGIGTQNLNSSSINNNIITGDCRGIVHYVFSGSNGNNNNFYKNYINVAQDALQFSSESGATFYNNSAYYNILDGGEYDSQYSGGWNVALLLTSPSTLSGTNYIYNNDIISGGNLCIVGTSTVLGNYNIENNIILGSNLSMLSSLIYIPGTTNLVFNRNLWYPTTNSKVSTYEWYVGSAHDTFAQWQAVGFDVSPTPSPADPLFDNTSGSLSQPRDFMIGDKSPAKGAGISVGLTSDYIGTTVSNPPSIGAYEFSLAPVTGLKIEH